MGLTYDLPWKMFNRQVDKGNVVYTNNGKLLSLKEGNSAVCNNMDEPGGRYTKQNKPAQRTDSACFHLYEESKLAKPIGRESKGYCQGLGGRGNGSSLSAGTKFQLYKMNKF